jgi:alcohol dehydrogenase class IV
VARRGLLDPELTLSLPPGTTLLAGIDALIHGLEAYISRSATPITDEPAWQRTNLVLDNLGAAVQQWGNLAARQALLEENLLTCGARCCGLGLTHAIGNVTGGSCHEPPMDWSWHAMRQVFAIR